MIDTNNTLTKGDVLSDAGNRANKEYYSNLYLECNNHLRKLHNTLVSIPDTPKSVTLLENNFSG